MQSDSSEYEILKNAASMIKNVEGFTCEIGLREGGSSEMILDSVKKNGDSKIHVAIDPYGNIEYSHWENRVERLDYSNQMKNKTLSNLYSYCFKNNMECLYFPLEDTEFFKRYSDGIPIYNEYKKIINTYALVFFDGPHTSNLVKIEFDFFKDKIPKGGVLIFDDIYQYPHMDTLDEYILSNGFKLLEKGNVKISYIKI